MTRMLPDLAYAGGYLVEGVGAGGVSTDGVGPWVAGVLQVGLVGGHFAPTCAYLDYISTISYKSVPQFVFFYSQQQQVPKPCAQDPKADPPNPIHSLEARQVPLYPVLVLHASFGKLTTLNSDMSANIENNNLYIMLKGFSWCVSQLVSQLVCQEKITSPPVNLVGLLVSQLLCQNVITSPT